MAFLTSPDPAEIKLFHSHRNPGVQHRRLLWVLLSEVRPDQVGSEPHSHPRKHSRSDSSGWDEAASGSRAPGWIPSALQTKAKGSPVGQGVVQALGCGRGCSGSLHGACGWAVRPSCMPASRGTGCKRKRGLSYTHACSPSPLDGTGLGDFHLHHLRAGVWSGHPAQRPQG